ncbi:ras-related protein raba4d-like [Anaeramoeba ignava]|uniref:Ras-related protein raba4d-like n=1 Tax=Anaeramoeba ignava TaxID=1746090 RepID=A0A9Q0LS91_ANAIG|nr:ras-related protein raba4d-like [Anaeramoeba ignava]
MEKRQNSLDKEEEYDCNSYVGKTNLLTQYCNKTFTSDTKATIGVEFESKILQIHDKKVKDTAGQERFRSVTQVYYRGSYGAFIVYDITNKESFKQIKYWIKELRDKVKKNIVTMLIGNKSDLAKLRKVPKEKGEKFAKKNNILFMETSAKDGTNVDKAFKTLITDAYNNYENNNDISTINLRKPSKKKKCC